jgi:hypothetical protein
MSHADRLADRLDRGDVAGAVLASDLDLDGAVAGIRLLRGERRHLLGRAEGNRIAERDPVANLAAQQVVDRGIERLALDVPQRHLDAGLGLLDAVECLIHPGDEMGDAERVLADHGRRQHVDVGAQQGAAPLEHAACLADAGDAGIGIDEHDRVVGDRRGPERGARDGAVGSAPRAPDGHRAYLDDLHARPLPPPITPMRKHPSLE